MMAEGKIPDVRCGEGFDAHRFTIGRKLILGGLEIPFELGLHGHSDADVLCHAIGDALLGSVSLGDLGKHFPDSDPQYEGISSIELLSRIREMVTEEGYVISNIDATLVVEMPKIAPHRDAIRKNIAETLQINLDRVSVKATTTEGMGPFGRGEGIACRAVALVVKEE
jgi:2-C-methyl-D-erythritol 2,4-cyclodiphosphate synthase